MKYRSLFQLSYYIGVCKIWYIQKYNISMIVGHVTSYDDTIIEIIITVKRHCQQYRIKQLMVKKPSYQIITNQSELMLTPVYQVYYAIMCF